MGSGLGCVIGADGRFAQFVGCGQKAGGGVHPGLAGFIEVDARFHGAESKGRPWSCLQMPGSHDCGARITVIIGDFAVQANIFQNCFEVV